MRRDSSRLRWSGPRPGPIASTVTEHHRSLGDRKSTRLNSSHSQISYAVFCLKKKKNKTYSIVISNAILLYTQTALYRCHPPTHVSLVHLPRVLYTFFTSIHTPMHPLTI